MSGDPTLEGRVLAGRFRVVRALGEGGMGAVYEAVQLGLERRVAIKVLAPELGEDPRFVERFRREAEAAARLMHPNIVQVTDFVNAPGEPVLIVMELLAGRALLDDLKQGPFPVARACGVATQLASALGLAHASGIVHRDLKPANVFLIPIAGGGDMVKLLDFGIAKLKESDGYHRLTQTGVLIGTPRFASPEQLMGERDVDARSDVFSLGVLLYGMLAGRPPFVSRGAELLVEIQDREPPELRTLRPTVPPALVEIVRRAMKKRREERFQTVDEMARALEPFLGWTEPSATDALDLEPPRLVDAAASTAAAWPASPQRASSTGPTVSARPSSQSRVGGPPPAAPAAIPPTMAMPSLPPAVVHPPSYPRAPTAPLPSAWEGPGPHAPTHPGRPAEASRPRAPAALLIAGVGLVGALVLVSAFALAALWFRSGEPSAAGPIRAPTGAAAGPGGSDDPLGPACAEWERRACTCLQDVEWGPSTCAVARVQLHQARVSSDRVLHRVTIQRCVENLETTPDCPDPGGEP